jgi:nucleotide-binding universal stress UspA family protein
MADQKADKRKAAIEEAQASLARMQTFDADTLPRIQELGALLNFQDAVGPAQRLIGLFQQVSTEVLESLSLAKINAIKQSADASFTHLDAILNFEPGTPKPDRDNRIQQLQDAYDPAFEAVHSIASYSVRHATDFEKIGHEARAVLQGVKDDAERLRKQMDDKEREADATLEAIKRIAAEQGVSQEAIHFKKEGDTHSTSAGHWLIATIVMTGILALCSVGALFLHKWEMLKPSNTFESIQLVVGKTLLFGTLFFMLAHCARNYLAHRHNAVVNKHRQNALATYTALVKAANDQANSDIILNRAAECIFSPQSSGYSKAGPEAGSVSLLSVGPNSVRAPGA